MGYFPKSKQEQDMCQHEWQVVEGDEHFWATNEHGTRVDRWWNCVKCRKNIFIEPKKKFQERLY